MITKKNFLLSITSTKKKFIGKEIQKHDYHNIGELLGTIEYTQCEHHRVHYSIQKAPQMREIVP